MKFRPEIRYSLKHESGRTCPADAAWLNSLEDRVFAEWRMTGWTIVEEPCPKCEQMRAERDEAKAMVAR